MPAWSSDNMPAWSSNNMPTCSSNNMPAWSSNNNRPPSAAGGGFAAAVVVAGPGQGKAGKTGPGQTKPRLGTTGKPAKPKQSSVSIEQIYSLYRAYIQVEECQIWDKIMKIGPNQVHMAPFGLIFSQDRSHRV